MEYLIDLYYGNTVPSLVLFKTLFAVAAKEATGYDLHSLSGIRHMKSDLRGPAVSICLRL
jgi:hypothetical protein